VAGLVEECRAGDLLVVNDTRVLPARLRLVRRTGARIEALLLEPSSLDGDAAGGCWDALLRPGRRVRAGDVLTTEDGLPAAVVEQDLAEGRWRLRWCFAGGAAGAPPVDGLPAAAPPVGAPLVGAPPVDAPPVDDLPAGAPSYDEVVAFLEHYGEVPLPPYLTAGIDDPERYQTVYARHPASAAAPTAGLHLTPDLLGRLAAAGVGMARLELVVGLGTFRPITANQVEDHVMHTEAYRVSPETAAAVGRTQERGGRVLAVGTTVVRALEAWAVTGQPVGRTNLFIRRGFAFRVVDRLLTNFHVPRSSLLVLVDAFVGPRWRGLYDEGLSGGYRFLSLGDAMLLERTTT
jgi:S-adenosylmethionine:tRNA ribosyltransferase-isomerase